MSMGKHESSSKQGAESSGISRRSFFGAVGEGVVGSAVVGSAAASPSEEAAVVEQGLPTITLLVNERPHRLQVQPRWTLLYVLREKLGMAGTKQGCERGECGACTVLIDGTPRYACMTLALEAEGHEVTTIEGLMKGEELGPVQEAFAAEDAFQCGYCTPGQVMSAEGLLRQNPSPSTDEIRLGMSGNLCRCGAYDHIVKAVHRAAGLRKRGADS
jgi:xanthine dehydrogenase YagT iron-sulfur-binding subunit